MTLQTLYDQLLELRIPAFRQALQEQQSNPQFTELAFEERLSLLVDHECTQRRENRIRRNLHTAAFPTSASSGRSRSVSCSWVWNDAPSWNWDNATGSPPARILLSLDRPARANLFWPLPLGQLQPQWVHCPLPPHIPLAAHVDPGPQ